MIYDGKIDIAEGRSAESKVWKNKNILWSDFLKRLADPVVTTETFKEFIAANKQEQHRIKDVGGYVGGYLAGGKRSINSVGHRRLLTLDIDFAHIHLWDDFEMMFDNAAILHATHKHSPESPRYRLIMPLSRDVSPEEYVAISRKIAGTIGIDLFDNTTFDVNRLMFWASIPKDVEYYFQYQDGPWLDADKVLAQYIDWKDSSLWATSDAKMTEIYNAAKKQEDPELKKGVIGAFCRTYTIEEGIEKFLPEIYTPTSGGRYTYSKGTTASGLITYDSKFAYSHHGTDPCSGKLCNVWDLVRIHLFGHLDFDAQEGSKLKSFIAMEDMVRDDKETRKTIASERVSEAKYDFEDSDLFPETVEEESVDWMTDLEVDGKGNYLSSAGNLSLIFSNDIRLKGKLRLNLFDNKNYITATMPWRRINSPEPISNVDYSGIRNYIECIYGITGTLKIDDALNLEFHKQSFHPIRDYLKSLEWDGAKRIDTLLIDLFGAPDNIYTREAIRKQLVASVARVYNPGVKYDMVLVLCGKAQGTGKSSFIDWLGKGWASDSFMGWTGKESMEQLHGVWLMEIAELSGFKKADLESIKHYITKREDQFRPAYGRTTETYPRQTVFWGTTNTKDFLRDSENRRFNPIDVHDIKVVDNPKMLKVFSDGEFLHQIWAEAVHLYRNNEPLILSPEAEVIAQKEQLLHAESDDRMGIIDKFLNIPLPTGWDDMEIFERQSYLSEDDEMRVPGKFQRQYICVAEIWSECMGKNKQDLDRYKSREYNDIMRSLPDWEPSKSTRNFKHYGVQKYYFRKLD
jgi:putative DNA primase/helicase